MTRKHYERTDICAVRLAALALVLSMTGAAVITESSLNESPSSLGENILEDDSGTLATAELSQGATTIIDELTPYGTDTMQTSDILPISSSSSSSFSSSSSSFSSSSFSSSSSSSSSSSRKDSTFAYTNAITTTRPSISPYPELRHRVTHPRPYHSKHHHEHHLGPFFEEPLNATTGALHVGVHLATEAVLNCRVGMLKDKTVMWVRRTTDKFSLLTVGNNTYSGDPRIRVKFQYPNNWRLHINPMQKEDAGLYMCQVSTHPPRVFATNVTVLPPAIRVIDEQNHEVHDRYYKIGSTIDLTCQVATSFLLNSSLMAPEPNNLLQYPINPLKTKPILSDRTKTKSSDDNNFYKKIIWRKDGEQLQGDASINISSSPGWLSSRLTILGAERTHSGIYSCIVLNSTSALVDVQILNGSDRETPAAVQHSSAEYLGSMTIKRLKMFITILVILYISC